MRSMLKFILGAVYVLSTQFIYADTILSTSNKPFFVEVVKVDSSHVIYKQNISSKVLKMDLAKVQSILLDDGTVLVKENTLVNTYEAGVSKPDSEKEVVFSQDTLVTTTGLEFYGSLIDTSGKYITFRPEDSSLNQSVLKRIVKSVKKGENPGDVVEKQELYKNLELAISELDFEEREIIILKEFEEHSYKEIAELLNIPIGTVMSRLYYARKKLGRILEGMMT